MVPGALRLRPLLVASALVAAPAAAQPVPTAPPASLPTIEKRTEGMERRDGFLPIYWDAAQGKLWLEVPRPGEEMIHFSSLPWGMGSNDIGLDRGQLGGERLVRFERRGPRLLLVQPNLEYRSSSRDAAERRTIEESFAQSVLWGFKVEAATGERVLVDATDFVLRDAHGIVAALRRTRQGTFRLEASRSAVAPERTKAFPRNTELEAVLTFTGDDAGRWVRDVTPSPDAITLRQRLSFVKLPEPGYVPRRNDPRAGYFGTSWQDYSAPLGAPLTQRVVTRHRLQKKDPRAAVSEPVAPIVYYLDPGVPEPMRSALLEGARWWEAAFEAAGFKGGYRVEILPDTADPLDVRYNVIQWVHRATRGWSYGGSIIDPRTGEIIKGHVTLGSLRVRQDFLIAEGLTAPYVKGDERATEAERMALQRLRQLSAHEVGHTLGLAHNYIASAEGRLSVMDYPHPVVTLAGDRPTLADAYTNEIGAWDRLAITWGYAEFAPGTDEAAALDKLLADARGRGITFVTDQDARPEGSAHPQAHLWDNGTDAAAELDRVMRVRRAALARFGEGVVQRGMPLAQVEEALVPLYLSHRYQVEAAVKLVAGQTYTYALRGDGQVPVRAVPRAQQHEALRALLATLEPASLALPPRLLALIPPRPFLYPETRELFEKRTAPVFDALAPAEVVARAVLGLLFNEQRAARLVQQHALDAAMPGLWQVMDTVVRATFAARGTGGYEAALRRVVQREVVTQLVRLAQAPSAEVRAQATQRLAGLRRELATGAAALDDADRAQRAWLAGEIGRFLERPYDAARVAPAITVPPGSPIGDDDEPLVRERP